MKIAVVSYWKDKKSLVEKLQNFDAVVATEQAALDLMAAGIPLLAAIADFDSIADRAQQIALLENYTEVIELPAEKDLSDTRAMLDYVANTYPHAKLTLLNTFDGRVDHSLALLSLFHQYPQLHILTPQSKLELVTPGTHEVMNLRNSYKYISFIVLEQVSDFEIKNFKYDTKQDMVEVFSDFLISNEFLTEKDGILFFSEGKILIIYSNDF